MLEILSIINNFDFNFFIIFIYFLIFNKRIVYRLFFLVILWLRINFRYGEFF